MSDRVKSAEEWQEELAGETSVESIRQIQANAIIGVIPLLTGYVLTDRQELARFATKLIEGKGRADI